MQTASCEYGPPILPTSRRCSASSAILRASLAPDLRWFSPASSSYLGGLCRVLAAQFATSSLLRDNARHVLPCVSFCRVRLHACPRPVLLLREAAWSRRRGCAG